MLGSGNVFAFSVVMPTAPVEENDVVRIDERAAPCKERCCSRERCHRNPNRIQFIDQLWRDEHIFDSRVMVVQDGSTMTSERCRHTEKALVAL